MAECASAHDCDDCILGQCEHPSHWLEDAVIDLRDFLGAQALCDPADLPSPLFL